MKMSVIPASSPYIGTFQQEQLGTKACARSRRSCNVDVGNFVAHLYQNLEGQSSVCKLSADRPGSAAGSSRPRRFTNEKDTTKFGSSSRGLIEVCCQVSQGVSSNRKYRKGVSAVMIFGANDSDEFRSDSEERATSSVWDQPPRLKRIQPVQEATVPAGDAVSELMKDLKLVLAEECHEDAAKLRDKPGAGVHRSRRRTAGLAGKPLTAADLANGVLNVQGWKVLRYETGEPIGVIDEIIHIGSPGSDEVYESVLKLVQLPPPITASSEEEGSYEEDGLEFLVPLVEDIVKGIDIKLKCLFIKPPEGLLELARIPEILKRLEPQLLEFCQHQSAGIQSCLDSAEAHKSTRFSEDAKQLVEWSRHIPHSRDMFMPTRRQLLSAGRHDLVDEIMAAGGFLSVAQALRLRSRRRPVGFWEDLRNLDAEIEWFVSGCWVAQTSPETGEEIFYNQVTDQYSRHCPSAGNVSNPIPVSQDDDDIGTAVMPRQHQVLEAGRYDLHHAILLHGGYKLVAQELGRQPVTRDSTRKSVAQLKRFMEENSFSTIPSFEELKTFRRYDLVYSLRKLGGINSVAQMLELRPKRYGVRSLGTLGWHRAWCLHVIEKGQWHSLDFAAAAIRSYMCNKLILEQGLSESPMDRCDLEDMVWDNALKAGTLEIPTQEHVLDDGRSDLRYLLQKYGRKDLAECLGIKYVDKRKRKRKRLLSLSAKGPTDILK